MIRNKERFEIGQLTEIVGYIKLGSAQKNIAYLYKVNTFINKLVEAIIQSTKLLKDLLQEIFLLLDRQI